MIRKLTIAGRIIVGIGLCLGALLGAARPMQAASCESETPTIADLWRWFDEAHQRLDALLAQQGATSPIVVQDSQYARRYVLAQPEGAERCIAIAPSSPTTRGAARCSAYIGGSDLPLCLFIKPVGGGAWEIAASGATFDAATVERLMQDTFVLPPLAPS